MADGYGFGGEGDWKTSVMLRTLKVVADGLPGGTSFMEDYTYHLVPGQELILGAHMLEVCPSIAAAKPSLEIHPLGIGGREDPVRLVFDAAPGDVVILGTPTWATASASSPTRSRWSPRARRCRTCPSRGRSGSRPPTCTPRPRPG